MVRIINYTKEREEEPQWLPYPFEETMLLNEHLAYGTVAHANDVDTGLHLVGADTLEGEDADDGSLTVAVADDGLYAERIVGINIVDAVNDKTLGVECGIRIGADGLAPDRILGVALVELVAEFTAGDSTCSQTVNAILRAGEVEAVGNGRQIVAVMTEEGLAFLDTLNATRVPAVGKFCKAADPTREGSACITAHDGTGVEAVTENVMGSRVHVATNETSRVDGVLAVAEDVGLVTAVLEEDVAAEFGTASETTAEASTMYVATLIDGEVADFSATRNTAKEAEEALFGLVDNHVQDSVTLTVELAAEGDDVVSAVRINATITDGQPVDILQVDVVEQAYVSLVGEVEAYILREGEQLLSRADAPCATADLAAAVLAILVVELRELTGFVGELQVVQ